MSQLIRMRQRIKAIKTIKKITHALRLISMSTHLRLRSKKGAVELYKENIVQLFSVLNKNLTDWKSPFFTENQDPNKPSLIILVGSQKGLCGNFNAELFAFYENAEDSATKKNAHYITIGKKAHDYAQFLHYTIVEAFDEFSLTTLENITSKITQLVTNKHENYSWIKLYSSYSKSFFSQKPHATSLVPFELPPSTAEASSEEFIWEQSPAETLNFLLQKLIFTTIYEALFQSLIAEQAARFIAMDNSTRSASKLLELMQLQYNKMRQSKITSELTDLVGGFF